jgi:hypothetical protein
MNRPRISERTFQDALLEAFGLYQWRAIHVRPCRLKDGSWRTAVQGPGCVGWPDVFAVRGDRALAAELKAPGGRLSPAQRLWLDALADAGVEAYAWSPNDWDAIEAVIR